VRLHRGKGSGSTNRLEEDTLLSLLLLLAASQAQEPFAGSVVGAVPARSMADDPGLFAWRAVPPVLVDDEDGELELRMALPDGFLVYRDSLRVTVLDPGTLSIGAPVLPVGRPSPVIDPDRPARDVVEVEVVIRFSVAATQATAHGLAALELQVEHQGCFEGRCLPPESQRFSVYVPIRSPSDEPATCPVDDD